MMQAGLGAFSPSRGGAAQPMGLSPGQMRPDMPNIPQIKPSGMGQAAALPSEVEPLKKHPREQLMQALMSPGERPPKWALVTALDQQAKENQMRQAQAWADAQRQVAGLGTVVQDVATRRLARGGVVGFGNGGSLGTQEEADRKRILGLLEQVGYGAQNLAAAGIDVVTLPVRALAGIYNTIIRAPRAFGVDIPFVPAAAGTESMTPVMDALTRSRAATAVEPPMGQPGGAFRGTRADMAPAGATPSTTPASPATPAARRGLGTGIDRSSRTPPPADTTPPPQTDGFDIKALQDAIREAGTVSPAVQAARDALEKQRQASLSARERRREAIASEGRSYGQLARATVGAKSFGEALALAAGAAADQRAEKNKRLQELDDTADRLREALAEKTLAERSGDDAARKAANVKLLEAQRDYIDKQRTFRIQEQEAQAKTTAAERSGSGGESRGLSAQVTGLNNLIKAADDTMNNMMLKQEVRDAAARDKARHIRSLEALLAGNSSLSGMSTADLLKTLGVTGGAKQ